MTSSSIVAVCSSVEESCLSLPSGFRADQYTLIRLSKVEGRDVLDTLDERIGTVNEVPNIEELSDRSWEICILKSHCCTARDMLGTIFPGSDVDLNYNPVEPTAKDLKIWNYDTAKELHHRWSFKRATRIVKNGWPAAAAYYTHFLEVMCGPGGASDQPLAPTYQGCLKNEGDAVYLVEACLQGKHFHAWRGPRDGEAAISGNIFVWEAKITGIDRWEDGMKWTVCKKGGFEVGKASDGSGLMKKTISISVGGRIHHVVSYYKAWARPSRNMTLRPELVSVLFGSSAYASGMLVEADPSDGQLQPAQVFK
jgi:hypothetical protein